MAGGALLALDLGQRCGWAIRLPESRLASGVWLCGREKHEDDAAPFLKFRSYLTEAKQRCDRLGQPITRIRYEKLTFVVNGHTATSAYHWGAFWGLLLHWAGHHRIECEGFHVATIKKRMTGSGRADKDAVIRAVRQRGYEPRDHNEADALALALISERG